jgi:CDGSH-type Zn-finger protein
MVHEPRIRITVDGPYTVRGLPVSPGRIVRTPRGESIEWEVDEPYEAGAQFLLCRCGRSETKPFCDDSHLEGFDGTEVADRGPTADRRGSTSGGGLTLTDDESLCTHAGFCRDHLSNAWDRMEAIGEPEVRAKVEAIVARCPSGRLVLLDEDDGPIEAAFEPGIVVEEDGPYWVRGGVRIESADGEVWETRNRVTLCRCGHSGNKPFCDATHDEIGFKG